MCVCVWERERERERERRKKDQQTVDVKTNFDETIWKKNYDTIRSLWQFFCRCCFKVASVEGWQSSRLIFSNFFVPVPTLSQFFCASVISNRLLKIQKKLSLFEIDAFSFTTVAAVSGLRSSTITAKSCAGVEPETSIFVLSALLVHPSSWQCFRVSWQCCYRTCQVEVIVYCTLKNIFQYE